MQVTILLHDLDDRGCLEVVNFNNNEEVILQIKENNSVHTVKVNTEELKHALRKINTK